MRSVLSGLASIAVRRGHLRANPVRDAAPIARSTTSRTPRALAVEETSRLGRLLRVDRRAVDLDLPDLVDCMLMTGVRLGEACAIRDEVVNVERGVLEINAQVIRATGQGIVLQRDRSPRLGGDESPSRPSCSRSSSGGNRPSGCTTRTARSSPARTAISAIRRTRPATYARSWIGMASHRCRHTRSARPSPPASTNSGRRHGRSPTNSATSTPEHDARRLHGTPGRHGGRRRSARAPPSLR